MIKNFGFMFIAGMTVSAALAPYIAPYDPHYLNLPLGFQGPGWSHPFGLDENGQDLFLKILHGARLSLQVAGSVIFISAGLGLITGALAGLLPGGTDRLLSGLMDLALAFPKFLTALALLSMWGPSTGNLILALSFSTWAGFARLIRGEVRRLKAQEFVLSARAVGAGGFFLLRRHIWPGVLSLLAVHGMFQAVAVLIAEAGLSFLGLGAGREAVSWGGLINSGREFILEAPHLCFFPGLFLFLFLFSLNSLGDALREKLRPRGG